MHDLLSPDALDEARGAHRFLLTTGPGSSKRGSSARAISADGQAGRWLLILLFAVLLPATVGAQLQPPPAPAGNPVTTSKANLGKALFWDEQLSSTRTVACGTCHIPATGGGDPRSATSPLALHPGFDGIFGTADDVLGSPGVPENNSDGTYGLNATFGMAVQVTGRRTISMINAAYAPSLFWDGRAGDELVDPITKEVVLASGAALETQALGPVANEVEMGHQGRTWTDALPRITASEPLALANEIPTDLETWIDDRSYADLFLEAFGSAEITASRAAMAIATYERTLFTDDTPFDEFLDGNDDAFTQMEKNGRTLFLASSCDRCHSFAVMSDDDFHYTGVHPPAEDLGLFDVTGLEEDRGKMRTPSLRNVELRPPYMHNGRLASLEEVVDFYDRGGDFDAPNKDPLVRELNLTTQEKAELVAFLSRPLTDTRLAQELAPFDRPILYTESDRVPLVEGTGVGDTSGMVPQVVALEPPLLGNPSFTVGIFDAGSGAQAVLAIGSQDPGLSDPGNASLVYETAALQDPGSGNRFGSISLELTDDAQFVGQEFFGRWYVTGTAPGGADSVSPLFRFTIFGENPEGVLFRNGFESGDTTAWD